MRVILIIHRTVVMAATAPCLSRLGGAFVAENEMSSEGMVLSCRQVKRLRMKVKGVAGNGGVINQNGGAKARCVNRSSR